jgi:hypothetical protein
MRQLVRLSEGIQMIDEAAAPNSLALSAIPLHLHLFVFSSSQD